MRNRVRIWTRVSFGLFQACSQLLNATRKSSHSWFLFKFMTTNPQWMLNSSGKSCYTPWFSSLSHVPKRRLHSFSLLLWCPAIPSHPFSHNRWLCLKILWENKSHQKDIPLSPPNKYGSLPTSVPLIPALSPVTKGNSYCSWTNPPSPSPLLEEVVLNNPFPLPLKDSLLKQPISTETCSIIHHL